MGRAVGFRIDSLKGRFVSFSWFPGRLSSDFFRIKFMCGEGNTLFERSIASASTFEHDQLVPGMSYNVELQAIRGDVVAASRLRFTSTAVSSPLEPRKRNNDRLDVLADRDMIADEIPYPVDARSMQQARSKKGG